MYKSIHVQQTSLVHIPYTTHSHLPLQSLALRPITPRQHRLHTTRTTTRTNKHIDLRQQHVTLLFHGVQPLIHDILVVK